MPEMTLAPVRHAGVTATRATRRLRLRRKRRTAIGEWWWRARVALHLEPRRRPLSDSPIPWVAGATAFASGLLLLVARRAARLRGRAKATMHQVHSTESAPDNNQTLADKVRTEMFRRPDAPKGAVNVSVVDGVVYLRGEVADLDEVQRLVNDALGVNGVMGVESMLHTPGTPAPTNGAG
jgi:BON domain